MTDLRTLVAVAVAAALLLCVGGIIYLAAVPDRPVPDVLVALSTGALGYLGGLFAPTPQRRRGQAGASSGLAAGFILLACGIIAMVMGFPGPYSIIGWFGLIAAVIGAWLVYEHRHERD